MRVLEWTTERFARAGLDSPRLEAQILLAHALSCDRVQLYTRFDQPLAPEELSGYRGLIKQRLAGRPVAYLIGEQEFWSLPFHVDPAVLIPRRDTETVIEVVLDEIDRAAVGDEGDAGDAVQAAQAGDAGTDGAADVPDPTDGDGELVYVMDEWPGVEPDPEFASGDDDGHGDAGGDPESGPAAVAGPGADSAGSRGPIGRARKSSRMQALRIVDLCTGSGAIAVTLASELPASSVIATDLSAPAAELARRNAGRNQVADRVAIRTGDLFAALGSPPGPDRGFDIVVSNPPYIPSRDLAGLSPEVRSEPPMALDGGGDGLDLVRRIIDRAPAYLVPGGLLVLEHGHDQADAVAVLFERSGAYEPSSLRRDLGRNPRVTYARTRR